MVEVPFHPVCKHYPFDIAFCSVVLCLVYVPITESRRCRFGLDQKSYCAVYLYRQINVLVSYLRLASNFGERIIIKDFFKNLNNPKECVCFVEIVFFCLQ